MLEKLKILLNINTKDDILNLLIENAKDYIVTKCNLQEYDNSFDNICVQMVIEDYRKQGKEGMNSTSNEGTSYSLQSDYSNKVNNYLKKRKRVKTL